MECECAQRRSTSTLYITFKVVQLVHQLRNRLRPRVSAARSSGKARMKELAKDFAKHASEGILRCLTPRNATKGKTVKRRKGSHNFREEAGVNIGCAESTAAAQSVLSSLSTAVRKQIGFDVLYVAEGDNRFLHQPELPVSDHLTYTQAAQKIQLINSALDILDILREDSVGGQSNLSEKVCANLEHLLLRIRECLVQTFVRKAWTEVSESPEWQHYWRRQLKFGGDKWCAEFSNNHRPVSTTWPWSIKPSLAVLWGVCWMFYPQGNEAGYQRPRSEAQAYGISPVYHYAQPVVGVRGVQHPILPSQGPRQMQSGTSPQRLSDTPSSDHVGGDPVQQNFPAPSNTFVPALDPDIRISTSHRLPQAVAAPQATPSNHRVFHQEGQGNWSQRPGCESNSMMPSSGVASAGGTGADGPADSPGTHVAGQAHSRYISPGQDAPSNAPGQQTFLKPEGLSQARSISGGFFASDTWQTRLQPVSATDNNASSAFAYYTTHTQSDPRVTGHQLATQPPQIPFAFKLPQAEFTFSYPAPNSNLGAYPYSAFPHQQDSIMSDRDTNDLDGPATAQMHPVLDPSIAGAEPTALPRGASEEAESPAEVNDGTGFSPRRGFTHKRNEDPPRNAEGKMVCKFTGTCGNLIFERRCEWSKHMDKHERPYKCAAPGCEKLQGFTYSGGLLRHQREVHKMHGGTKKALYCPEPNCKRNSGSGFTRKENLSEHIRRVHRRQTSLSEGALPRDDTIVDPSIMQQIHTTTQIAEEAENLAALAEASSNKRKFDSVEASEDVESELKKVKRIIREKDDQINSLQQQVAEIQRQLALRNGEQHFEQ